MPIQQMLLAPGAGGAEPLGNLPVSGALWYYDGFYATESGSNITEWLDQSGNNRHVTTANGRMASGIAQDQANKGDNYLTTARKYIKNTTNNHGIRWNGTSGYWPGTNYTLMHIMGRQLTSGSGSIGRIWDGFGINWLSGYHDTNEGVFYHNGWFTLNNLNSQTSFLVCIDRKDKVRAKGKDVNGNNVDSGYISGSGGAPTTANGVGINCGNYSGGLTGGTVPPSGECSFWKSIMCACWNGDIGDSDCNTLINWGFNKLYG